MHVWIERLELSIPASQTQCVNQLHHIQILRVQDASGRNCAGYEGFEPTTNRLTVYCSTTELIPHITHTVFNLTPLLRSCFLWSILSVWVYGPRQARTTDTKLFKRLPYQLSYRSIHCCGGGTRTRVIQLMRLSWDLLQSTPQYLSCYFKAFLHSLLSQRDSNPTLPESGSDTLTDCTKGQLRCWSWKIRTSPIRFKIWCTNPLY